VRFQGTVVFQGDDFDDLLASVEETMVANEERAVAARCRCTWTAAAADADGPWQTESAPLFAQAKRPSMFKVARRKKLLEIARQVNELWQTRMRTMVDHPAYGRPDPACVECRGAGRVAVVEYAKFDMYSEVLPGLWGETLTKPCLAPRVWPWSDDLVLRFYLLCSDAGVPSLDVDEIFPSGVLDALPRTVTAELDMGKGIVPVSRLLELDAVPYTLVLVDPTGRWLEHEEVEIAEDLASWHSRLTNALRETPNANAALVEFHA
jgi:hypothetical protein